jgi:hypothetical protein
MMCGNFPEKCARHFTRMAAAAEHTAALVPIEMQPGASETPALDMSKTTAVLLLRIKPGCNDALAAVLEQMETERSHALCSQRCWSCHSFMTHEDLQSDFANICLICFTTRRDSRAQPFRVYAMGNTDEEQAALDSIDSKVFLFDEKGVCVNPSCRLTAYLNSHAACVHCCFPGSCWLTVSEHYVADTVTARAAVEHDSWTTMFF